MWSLHLEDLHLSLQTQLKEIEQEIQHPELKTALSCDLNNHVSKIPTKTQQTRKSRSYKSKDDFEAAINKVIYSTFDFNTFFK